MTNPSGRQVTAPVWEMDLKVAAVSGQSSRAIGKPEEEESEK